MNSSWIITRRDFLKASAAVGASAIPIAASACARTPERGLQFGLVADIHYADREPLNQRIYRDSLAKLGECVEVLNESDAEFLIELGDFKDQDDPPEEQRTLSHLRAIEEVFQRFDGGTYHVLGNHDVDSLSKEQFQANISNTGISPERTYYSFDSHGFHFVVLDANFSADGSDYDHDQFDIYDTNIAPDELAWLEQDLAATDNPAMCFIHQNLHEDEQPAVCNAAEVRAILEASGKVLAVFQAHVHTGGLYQIGGIYYYGMRAMVEGHAPESSSYALVDVNPDNSIIITGYRRAVAETLIPVE